MSFEWDWPGIEREFKHAIALDPNYVPALHKYSHYLILMGRFDGSLTVSQRALALDPLAVGMTFHLGAHYYRARQYDLAVTQVQKALAMSPNHTGAHAYLGFTYAQQGRYNEAIAGLQKSPERGVVDTRGDIGQVYALAGRRAEAEKLLTQLHEEAKHKPVSSYHIAGIYAVLGEKDQAFVWLEKAIAERDPNFTNQGPKVDVQFDNLRSDPRFADLLRRMGLAQ